MTGSFVDIRVVSTGKGGEPRQIGVSTKSDNEVPRLGKLVKSGFLIEGDSKARGPPVERDGDMGAS